MLPTGHSDHGEDGQDGSKGIKGEDGEDGTDGRDGEDGTDGEDGQDGSKGMKGEDGEDGMDGRDGQDGPKGMKGEDGEDGTDGGDGEDGTDGEDGQDGSKGMKGEDGEDGTDGEDGQDGSKGMKGEDGTDGEDGQDGSKGMKGEDGEDGTDGEDGQDGSKGMKGEDGEDGTDRGEESRHYNWERLSKQACAGEINHGDHVVVVAQESTPLDPKWDHGYVVTRVRGSVITVVGPRNRRRVLNRDKIKLAHPDSDWQDLRPRLTRTQRRGDAGPTRELEMVRSENRPISQPETSDRVLRSAKRRLPPEETAVIPRKLGRQFGPSLLAKRRPSPAEQLEAKRQCIAAVQYFCSFH